MDPRPRPDLTGDPDDVAARLARHFIGWHIIHTTTGWWATRSILNGDNLSAARDLRADTAEALCDLLDGEPRRTVPRIGPGSGINV